MEGLQCVWMERSRDWRGIWRVYISSSKFSVYFTRKNLLFLFYTTIYIKHPYQFFYFTKYFNKIFTFLIFLLFLSTAYLYMRALTLSLYSFFLNWRPLSLSLSLSFLPFLILSQKRPIQITSSPGPFFIGRSRFFLHRPILSSPATQILSF